MALPSIRKKQIRFSVKEDINLLKEVLAENPFREKTKWSIIADNLQENTDKVFEVNARRVRERTYLLLNQYSKEDRAALKRSGTDEEYTEKSQLLQEILVLSEEEERVIAAKKEEKDNSSQDNKAKLLRKRAMETLTLNKPECSDGETCTASLTPSKVAKGNAAIVEYLKVKSLDEKELKKEEINIRKSELQLERERFELEREERRQRLELDRQQQLMMIELIRTINK